MNRVNAENVNYKKISIFYLFGTLFNQGISFLTVPVFTRLLTTYDYGMVTTYLSWVAITSMIISCAIYMGMRAAFIDYEETIDDVLSSLTTFTLCNGALASVLVVIACLIFAPQVSMTLVICCMAHSIGAALLQTFTMYLMMQYRYKLRTALLVLPNLIAVIASIVCIAFFLTTDKYYGRIVPTALSQVFFGLITVILTYKYSRNNKIEYVKYALAISLPLVLHGIALNILSQSDRLMITLLRDTSETGTYSLIYNFGMIATVITTSLEGVWVPWFTEKLKNNETENINQRSTIYIGMITCLMCALILAGPEGVKILASDKFWDGIPIIPPIVLSNYFIFAYTLYVNIEHYYKKTPYITVNTLIAAAVNIGLNFILIPEFGYIAAAYTTLISYFVAFVLHARYAKKLKNELYPIKFFIKPILLIAISVATFYSCINLPVVRWIIGVLICIIWGTKNRQNIIAFIRR